MNKAAKITILAALILALAAAIKIAGAVQGCCTNPNPPATCTDAEQEECCPEPAAFPSYYQQNVTSKQSCIQYFFKSNNLCENTNLCSTVGCCCYSDNTASPTYGAACNETFKPGPNEARSCTEICGTGTPPDTGCASGLTLTANSIKGEKQIDLNWQSQCEATSYKISRCKGKNCKNFQPLSGTIYASYYKDTDPSLEWMEFYTYNVTAKINDKYHSITKYAYTGDIECWKRYSNSNFCVHEYLYTDDPIKGYLISVLKYPSDEADFSEKVVNDFSSKFNTAMRCDDNNVLKQSRPQCVSNQVCTVTPQDEAKCIDRTTCSEIGKPFGLFMSKAGCEDGKYCFYDKSQGNVNACYNCTLKMSCYDYKTRDSCETNNCGIGSCEWKPVNDKLGTGACIDLQKNNCDWCFDRPEGTIGIESNRAYNEIFEACSPEKLKSLSTNLFDCSAIQQNCDRICLDFSRDECDLHTPLSISEDNYLVPNQYDECGLNACKWYGAVESASGTCKKNADRDPKEDCQNSICEADYFPPSTELIKEDKKIRIVTYDRKNTTDYGKEASTLTTYICVEKDSQQCDDASTFPYSTTQKLISIQELADLGIVTNGNNQFSFYSVDENKNLERVKKASIDILVIPSEGTLSISVKDGQNSDLIAADIYVDGKHKGLSPLTASLRTGEHNYQIQKKGYKTTTGKFTIRPAETTRIDATISALPPPPNTGNLTASAHDSTIGIGIMADISIDGENSGTTPMTKSGMQKGTHTFTISKSGYRTATGNFEIIVNSNTNLNISLTPLPGPAGTGNLSILTTDAATEKGIFAEASIDGAEKLITPVTITGLTPGIHKYNITKQGYNDSFGEVLINPSEKRILRVVMTPIRAEANLEISIIEPRLMATMTRIYDLAVETNKQATCKLSTSDTPYDSMHTFFTTQGNMLHSIRRFSTVNVPIYIKCKDFGGDVASKTARIQLIESNPTIKLFANPQIIWAEPVVSNLTVESDQEVACRHSKNEMKYEDMTLFEGTDEDIPESYSKQVQQNMTSTQLENGQNTIFVTCKNKAGSLSENKTITITVNAHLSPQLTLEYKEYYSTRSADLTATTNKEAECIYANNSIYTGNSSFGRKGVIHQTRLHLQPGAYRYHIRCTFPNKETREAAAEFTIDETAPTSPIIDDGETSNDRRQLTASWNSTDPESGIKLYQYQVVEKSTDKIILNWVNTTRNRETIRNLNLTDRNEYYINVMALNNANLWSRTGKSDGVYVSFSSDSDHCTNRRKDADETGIDCGGRECSACNTCSIDRDCESGSCVNRTCTRPTCFDYIKNQNETDIDCGGNCVGCENTKACISDKDCMSFSCANQKCSSTQDTCSNNRLDAATESDVDCGNQCSLKGKKCDSGKQCTEETDCKSGKCLAGKCKQDDDGQDKDTDGDGVNDNADNCVNDRNPDQKDTDDDGFGDECDEEKASTGGINTKLIFWALGIITLIGIAAVTYRLLKKKNAKPSKQNENQPFTPMRIQPPTPPQQRIRPETEHAILKKREKDLEQKRKDVIKQFEAAPEEKKPDEDDVFKKLKSKTSEIKGKKK
ncbi:PEGA domain-containing protein [Candidatus Woesearchaeota archaeon]|nr:PEGA domain-containing protein [Candidatus Woesearchaeota archaeon]